LIKTPGAPDEASCKTSPIRVITFAEVVGSKQAQSAVGELSLAYYQTPVKISHILELALSRSVDVKIA